MSQTFTLYAFAESNGRIRTMAERRIPGTRGSILLRVRPLRTTFPATAAGYKRAADWSFNASVRANAHRKASILARMAS